MQEKVPTIVKTEKPGILFDYDGPPEVRLAPTVLLCISPPLFAFPAGDMKLLWTLTACHNYYSKGSNLLPSCLKISIAYLLMLH